MIVTGVTAASTTQACDSGSGVCVAFAIPITSDDSSSDQDILVTVQAPGDLGWVGFGFGEQMTGSLVFPMWADDTNVVVSPRYASSVPY
jgi:Cytochrome domain of cellobiose dehydrogenase